jgi:hypothetical protein
VIFRRRRVPAWSALDDRRAHDTLVELVREQLREADLSVTERDHGRLLDVEGGATIDLGRVSEGVAELPAEAWPDEVRGRIASATNPSRAPRDPAALLPAVRVRLVTMATLEGFPKQLPHRQHADLAEVLVIDAAGLVWAGERDLAPLGLELDELFALGRENVREREPVRTSALDVPGATLTVAEGSNDYVASWSLVLDDLVDLPDTGALVAVPTARTLLVHPLRDTTDAEAAAAVRATTTERFDAGPKRLSPELYRWQDGSLVAAD